MVDRPPTWSERRSRLDSRWQVPLHRLEWAFEWLNYGISRWAFVAFLDQVARFSVLVVVIVWIAGAADRRRERHYQAWQTISAAQGKTGDLGRSIALRDLAASEVDLAGVDLTGAVLWGIELPGVHIPWGVLDSTTCTDCDFSRASMSVGRFRAAWLTGSTFRNTGLNQADFQHAQAEDVDFGSANLSFVRLAHARLEESRFRAASLGGALLDSAVVGGVDFTGADLRHASLRKLRGWREISSLRGANVHGVLDPPEGFVAWAVDSMGAAVAPTIEEWRQQVGDLLTDQEWRHLEYSAEFGGRSSRAWWEHVDRHHDAGDGR